MIKVYAKSMVESGNPYHEPAGSPDGGQFAHTPGANASPSMGISYWAHKAVGDWERDNASSSVERLVAFDTNGKVVAVGINNKKASVTVSYKDRNAVRNAVMSHNHPSGGQHPLNIVDLETAMNLDVAQERAVTYNKKNR